MQFVKAYWMSLVSGVVALVGIAVAVIGMTGDTVIQQMNQRVQSAREISTLQSDPHNQETINAEKEAGQKREQDYEAVVKAAETINERKPLLEGVFPEPAQLSTPYTFREAYRKKIWELPREMKAGELPSATELQDEAEIQADMARRKKEQEGDTTETVTPASPVNPTTPRGVHPGVPPVPPTPGPGRDPGRDTRVQAPVGRPPATGQPTAGGPRPAGAPTLSTADQEQVRRRADIKKARSIRVYAATETSLHVSPIFYTEGTPPTPQEMWYAQVGLWVQEDLVKAIARVNDEAAQRVGEKEANVANMPVKRVESIRVLGYVTADGTLVAFPAGTSGRQSSPGDARPGGGGVAPASFTGKHSDDQFDVIRVVLTAVVDKRELLKLVDSVTRANFYQLVGADYTAIEGTDTGEYLYGGAPLVRAELDFEGYMSRKIFKGMMPADVLRDLGIAATPPQGK